MQQIRAIQKTAEAPGDLIGNKVADKILSVSKKSAMELHNNDEAKKEDAEITTHKKRYVPPEERQQIINELRLIPQEKGKGIYRAGKGEGIVRAGYGNKMDF